MICMTLDCLKPTQFSVIQTIHCNVGLKCFFFNFCQNVCLLLFLSYVYFIDILQGSVEMHLLCGEICNNSLSQIVCRVCP